MAFGSMNSGDDMPMAEINVTPLVDVMLVLLIVFMITMPVLTHSITLQLPTASADAQPKTEPKDSIQLSIDADGLYYLGADSTEEKNIDEIKAELKRQHDENQEIILAIAADKDVAYDYVAQALDAARESGIGKIGFLTETTMPSATEINGKKEKAK